MRYTLFIFALFFSLSAQAQLTQSIRGQIMDSDSKSPLFGATIMVMGSDPVQGSVTDIDGNFLIEETEVGRVSLKIQMLGYEDVVLQELSLTSGKELYLNVNMNSAYQQLEVVEIKAESEDHEVLNEMATVSARSFSVEETQRYAASAFDPGRMALAFSGVATAGDDLMNEISVRGNSPRGILWRLEGIEIPNPNHFGTLGSSGGGISMLSSSTLSTSDFYTGAFPSEFGNATSGVFDLNLRNGNDQIREHSFMVGALGLEAATEGYFNKNSNASYLINYRYSTFELLSKVYNPIGDVVPFYQDLSFKLNFPKTPIGSLSIFALGGDNNNSEDAEADSTLWEGDIDNSSFRSDQQVGIIGAKNVVRLNDKAYFKNVLAYSVNRYKDISYEHDLSDFNTKELFDITKFKDDQISFATSLNYKLNARNTFKAGANASFKNYDLKYDNRDLDDDIWTSYIDSKGKASQYDLYAHWKHRITEQFTSNAGVHSTYLPFNNTYSIEPRAALTYATMAGNKWNLSLGLHSKPEHISTYFLEHVEDGMELNTVDNKHLEIPKALHAVLGYKFRISEKTRANVEAYYQYHYDVPVEALDSSTFSILNAVEIWGIVGTQGLSSQGKGRSYGVDLSVEGPLSDGYYYMANASLYKSEFRTYGGEWFNSRFNGDYILSLTGGKEWKLKNPNKSIGINSKILATGGNRITPVVLDRSIAQEEGIYDLDRVYDDHAGNYFRLDLGLSYRINRKNSTHTLMVDVQNVTAKENLYTKYFNEDLLEMESVYQLSVFPFINYRIEFQGKKRK